MSDAIYQKFVKRWEEVTELPPQTLGPFTPYYKAMTKRLKVMPWPVLVVSAGLLVVSIYLVIGPAITFLVSLLQRGF